MSVAASQSNPRASPQWSEGAPVIVLSAICYGLITPLAAQAARLDVPGTQLVAVRVVFLFTLVAIACVMTRQPLHVPREQRRAMLSLGLTSALIGPTYLSSVAFIPVGVAAVVFYTYPLLILIASPFVDGARPNRFGIAAFGLAFIGITLAVGTSFAALDWRGLALAALASVTAATQFFFAARAPGGGGLRSIFWTQAISVPLVGALALFTAAPGSLERLVIAWPQVTGVSLLYLVAFGLYMRGMRRTAAATAGLIFCLEPVVSMVVAALVLDERLLGAQYVGATLVLAGIVLNMTLGKRNMKPVNRKSLPKDDP